MFAALPTMKVSSGTKPQAAYASAKRIGWTWKSSFKALDDIGDEVDRELDSPAAIKTRVAMRVMRWNNKQVAAEFPTS